MTASIEQFDLTPPIAQLLLNHNARNRNIRSRRTNRYSRDIVGDRWTQVTLMRCSGPGRIVTRRGRPVIEGGEICLEDGQHRCEAVLAAGLSIPVIMHWHADPDAKLNDDTQIAKTFGDFLRHQGQSDSDFLASMTRWAHAWHIKSALPDPARQMPKTHVVTTDASPAELWEFLNNRHPEVVDSLRPARRIARKLKASPTAMGLVYWVLSSIDPEETDAFFERLETGRQVRADDPIWCCREALRNRSSEGRLPPMHQVAFAFKAFNVDQTGGPLVTMRYRPGGSHPDRFPIPTGYKWCLCDMHGPTAR